MQAPIQEVHIRLQRAWCRHVGRIISARPGFEGMATVDVHASVAHLRDLPEMDQGVLRVALNGTFYTNDSLKHIQQTECDACGFCGAADGIMHRNWNCPFFASARTHCSEADLDALESGPPCLALHGWVQEARAHKPFLQALGELPDTIHRYEPCTVTAPVIDLFVDGACRDPTDPAIRVASWAVHLVQVGDHAEEVNPLAGGVLPGLVQTAARAEITAMVSAVWSNSGLLRVQAATGSPGCLEVYSGVGKSFSPRLAHLHDTKPLGSESPRGEELNPPHAFALWAHPIP